MPAQELSARPGGRGEFVYLRGADRWQAARRVGSGGGGGEAEADEIGEIGIGDGRCQFAAAYIHQFARR